MFSAAYMAEVVEGGYRPYRKANTKQLTLSDSVIGVGDRITSSIEIAIPSIATLLLAFSKTPV